MRLRLTLQFWKAEYIENTCKKRLISRQTRSELPNTLRNQFAIFSRDGNDKGKSLRVICTQRRGGRKGRFTAPTYAHEGRNRRPFVVQSSVNQGLKGRAIHKM